MNRLSLSLPVGSVSGLNHFFAGIPTASRLLEPSRAKQSFQNTLNVLDKRLARSFICFHSEGMRTSYTLEYILLRHKYTPSCNGALRHGS